MWKSTSPRRNVSKSWVWDINGKNLFRLEKITRFEIITSNNSNVLKAHYDSGFRTEYIFPIYASDEINDVYKFISETFGNDMKYPG